MPPKVGESYITEFARRKLKLDDELPPKPALRKTLLVETKLPLLTPRKPSVSPNFLNGVSMLPSLTVPHFASRPANESRWFSTPVASSKVICDSNCQIPFSPAPISFLPRKPRYELPVSISFLFIFIVSSVICCLSLRDSDAPPRVSSSPLPASPPCGTWVLKIVSKRYQPTLRLSIGKSCLRTGNRPARPVRSTPSASIRLQFVAPRFQCSADLAVDACLRQCNTGFSRHLGDDRHIVLGPSHGLAAPFLERAVGAARDEQRLPQRLDVRAVVPRKRESLVVGDQARPQDQIVDGLGDLRGADPARVHHVRRVGAQHRG